MIEHDPRQHGLLINQVLRQSFIYEPGLELTSESFKPTPHQLGHLQWLNLGDEPQVIGR